MAVVLFFFLKCLAVTETFKVLWQHLKHLMYVPCWWSHNRACDAVGVTPASHWCWFSCECRLISEHNCGISAWWGSCNEEPRCHLQIRAVFWSTILLMSKLLVSNGDTSWAVLQLSCRWTSHRAGHVGKAKGNQISTESESCLHWENPQPSDPGMRGLDLAKCLSLCLIFGVGWGGNRVTLVIG